MDLGLEGKRAIITGGTRGIGAAIVDALVAEGAHVATCARNSDDVAALAQSAKQNNHKIIASVCDVGDKVGYETWLGNSVTALGGVDIFVANVSGMGGEGEEGWKRSFDVDLMATVRGCESLLAPMAQDGGGSMIIISSISGLESVGGAGAYGTIKAGLIAYSSQLAEMAGAHGIRVNAVSPGPIHVDDGFWGNVKSGDPQMYDAVCARHPSGRMGTTQEVANCVAFLASDAASWVTATNLIVDGGMTKRVQF